MKVKNPSYLRSLTALLRSSVKNSSDPNEVCEPWYVTVPSVTYFWTHRPQWRRRHKKRKQSNPPRFPVSTYSRFNDEDLLDTLKILERPLSRASTSPYETCSSKQIVVDSESPINSNNSDNQDDYDSSTNKKKREFDRNPSANECRSDSGLRKLREQQIIRSIRSQRRLGSVRNVVNNGQAGTVTFSSAEVNQTVQSFQRCESQLNCCALPKRRVTFNNCVSTESSIDTKNRKNTKIRETDAHHQRQESYARLSEDDDDDISFQTDLDHLFSSMIFDLSSKSSLSIDSLSRNSKKQKKIQSPSYDKTGESVFYINSSYLKKSSSDLMSIKKIFSISDHLDPGKFIHQKSYKDVKNSKITKFPTKNKAEENIVSNLLKKSLNNDNDSIYQRSIERIIFKLKDLTDKKMAPPPQRIIDHGSILSSLVSKNHTSTDTNDLVEIYRTPKLSGVSKLPKSFVSNVGLNISGIIDLIKPPIGQMNTIFHELSVVDEKAVTSFQTDKRIDEDTGKMCKYKNTESSNCQVEEIDLLRIETETDGEYESIFIEMKDLHENLRDGSFFEKLHSPNTEKCSETEPIVINNLPKVQSPFESSTSSSYRNDHKSCSIDECCTICGRTKIENPRYLRPVCRVKGVTLDSRLENDPWINVINRMNKHESGRKIMPVIENKQRNDKTQSSEEFSKVENAKKEDEKNVNDGIVALVDEEPDIVEKEEMEYFSVLVTETDNSISTDDSNSPGWRDQSTSCSSPESGLDSLSSYDCGTRLRGQLAKAYCTRESVRTVNVTSNRLLCVISESDTLMGLPQFLPKKPPDWFPRQVPTRKSSRR